MAYSRITQKTNLFMCMKKLLLIGLSVLMVLSYISSANAKAPKKYKKAHKYNDAIINEQHGIAEEFVDFFSKFKTGKLEDLKAERLDLIQKLNLATERVKAMPDFKGDYAFRDGALELFYFYKSTLDLEYDQMIHLIADRDRSAEDLAKLRAFRDDLVKREEEIDNKFEAIQVAFAKKHDLELVSSEIKKK